MRPFTVLEPATSAEASAMLSSYGERAAVYAGGTELLLVMKEGLAYYEALVNVKTIPGLDRIAASEDGHRIGIGALVSHRRLELSPLIRRRAPALAEAEREIANVRVRNTGTIGGNVCFGEPHADPATALLLYEASVTLESARGRRETPLSRFLVGPLEVARERDEVLTEVALAIPPASASAYLRFAMLERPSVGVGVALLADGGGGGIREARIAVGCVGGTPCRVPEAEAVLTARGLDEIIALAGRAGGAAAAAVDPVSDLYGSAEYKRHLVGVLVRRALDRAARRLATTGDTDAGER